METGKRANLSEETKQTIATDYNNGGTLRGLARKNSVSQTTITRTLENLGIQIRSYRGSTTRDTSFMQNPELIGLVASDYLAGKAIISIKIDRKIEASESTILSALRRAGVQLRKSGKQREVDAYVSDQGYRIVRIDNKDPMWLMARTEPRVKNPTSGTLFEHRLILARKLGRPLTEVETVHHINGNRQDNRTENLELRVGQHGKGATNKHCEFCRCFEHKAQT